MKLDFAFDQGKMFLQNSQLDGGEVPMASTMATRPRSNTPVPIRGAQNHVLLRDAKSFQPNFKPTTFFRSGFCISLSLEWSGDCVMGRVFDPAVAPYRAISHQRAFVMAYESRLPEMATKSAPEQIHIDQELTKQYITRFYRNEPVKFSYRTGLKLSQLNDTIAALPLSRAMIINMMGKVEGHAISVAHGISLFRYFDSNQGQFSEQVERGPNQFAEAVADNISRKYSSLQECIDVYEVYR
jgi:hypothetical protein